MSTFMLPPMADEPAPRGPWHLAFIVAVLVIIIAAAFRLGRSPEFDEGAVKLELPATADTLSRGRAAYRNDEFVNAYRLLRPHADLGDVESQRMLGWLFGTGFDGAYLVDHCTAAVWLDRAARAGNPWAMARLGEYYFRGVGVARDPIKGYLWARQAEREFARHPDIPPEQAKQMMAYVKRATTFDYRRAISEGARPPAATPDDWSYAQEPPVVVQPLPDIPIVDFFVMAISGTRQGCHAAPWVSPSDWWVNESSTP
jgi:hypothetical protein